MRERAGEVEGISVMGTIRTWEAMDIKVMFDRIESSLDGAFRVLDGDHDSAIVRSVETGKEYGLMCILAMADGSDEMLAIDSEGYGYVRYGALVQKPGNWTEPETEWVEIGDVDDGRI